MVRAFHRADCHLIAYVLALDANRYPTVSTQLREEPEERRVDRARDRTTELAVVEARGRFKNEWRVLVAVHRTQEVVRIDHVLVETVRRLARDDVFRIHLNRHGVIIHDHHARRGTAAEVTAAVIIRGSTVVVARIRCRATPNFKFIAYAVAVRIRQAVAVAVVAGLRIRTAAVVKRSGSIKIARCIIRTSRARAVFTTSIVICSERIIITSEFIGATLDFKFIANFIAVSVVDTGAVAVVTGVRERAASVIKPRRRIVVTGSRIRATGHAVRAAAVIVLSCFIVVVSCWVGATTCVRRSGRTEVARPTEFVSVVDGSRTFAILENLEVDGSGNLTLRGDLHEQHAAVRIGQPVRGVIQYVPSATGRIVHVDVLARKRLFKCKG